MHFVAACKSIGARLRAHLSRSGRCGLDVCALRLEPGDILVLQTDRTLSREARTAMMIEVRRTLDASRHFGVQMLLLDEGWRVRTLQRPRGASAASRGAVRATAGADASS